MSSSSVKKHQNRHWFFTKLQYKTFNSGTATAFDTIQYIAEKKTRYVYSTNVFNVRMSSKLVYRADITESLPKKV